MRNVSVVIATFNGQPFIREQLNSILSQTVLPSEIVICDDGSSDGTVEEIKSFGATSPVLIRLYLNEKRLGYSDNFLKGARLSRCEFIAFCDQDDIWSSQKLEKCLAFIAENDVALCAHTARLVDENGKFISIMGQKIRRTGLIAPRTIDPWGMFAGFSQIFHRSILEIIPADQRGIDSNTFEKILPHDRWTYFLASHFCKIGVINEPLVNYRQHSRNTYGIKHKTLWDRFIAKTHEGPNKLAQFANLADYRVDMLESNRSRDLKQEFDLAIARWKSVRDFCQLRFTLYSSKYFAVRLLLLVRCLCYGAYLPYRFSGLGPKRLLEDISLGLFGTYFTGWGQR